MNKYLVALVFAVCLALGIFAGYMTKNNGVQLGSVNIANDYRSTTTLSGNGLPTYVKTTPGALGSVIVVSTTVGQFEITDTDGVNGTSTIFKSQASLPAGTYTFDRSLQYGLAVSSTASFNGQFITTYR